MPPGGWALLTSPTSASFASAAGMLPLPLFSRSTFPNCTRCVFLQAGTDANARWDGAYGRRDINNYFYYRPYWEGDYIDLDYLDEDEDWEDKRLLQLQQQVRGGMKYPCLAACSPCLPKLYLLELLGADAGLLLACGSQGGLRLQFRPGRLRWQRLLEAGSTEAL
jgi:hypothetical protein